MPRCRRLGVIVWLVAPGTGPCWAWREGPAFPGLAPAARQRTLLLGDGVPRNQGCPERLSLQAPPFAFFSPALLIPAGTLVRSPGPAPAFFLSLSRGGCQVPGGTLASLHPCPRPSWGILVLLELGPGSFPAAAASHRSA